MSLFHLQDIAGAGHSAKAVTCQNIQKKRL